MHLPARFAAVILTFVPVFLQQRTWRHAERLLIGAILAPGKRTVTSLLRIAGLSRERRFTTYHRVLNRAVWDPRAAARLLLRLLVAAFAPTGPVVLGIDDTIERRRQRYLPRPGPLLEEPFRQGQRPPQAEHHALGPHSVGGTHLGAAVPHRARAVGTLLPRARPAAQKADRLGAADGTTGTALAARARDRAAGRQQLRRFGLPGDPGPAWPHRHHAPAAGRSPVRTRAAAQARDGRAPAYERRAPAEPLGRAGR